MTLSFDNWTDYDKWLIENYANFSIYKIDETNGKVIIEYCTKEEFNKLSEEK